MSYPQLALAILAGIFFAIVMAVLLGAAYFRIATGRPDDQLFKLSVVFMAIASVMCVTTWFLGIRTGYAQKVKNDPGVYVVRGCERGVTVRTVGNKYQVTCEK